jgi:hypothetical protein
MSPASLSALRSRLSIVDGILAGHHRMLIAVRWIDREIVIEFC